MTKRGPAQGELDGLCGLYCIVEFMHAQRPILMGSQLTKKEVFWHILETAYQRNLMRPEHIADGYCWYDLEKIFNATCSNLHIQHHAQSLRAEHESTGMSGTKLFKSLIHRKGGAIFAKGKCHWALAYKIRNDAVSIFDPSHGYLAAQVRFPNSEDGLAILPKEAAHLA